MDILVCLSLLGYCFALRRFSSFPIEYTPFFIISTCITLLYIFAYNDCLKIGTDALLCFGGLFLIFSPLFFMLDKKQLAEKYFTPGFVFSIAVIALFLFLSHGVHFAGWDEFTHWGPHDKLVYFNNGFINASDITIHKSYPLGGALFHYLFFRLAGFSEGTAYVAQCLLIMAPLSIFVSGYTWSSWKKVFIFYAIALCVLLALQVKIGPVDSLYMDSAVGIFFGMSIVSFLHSNKSISAILYLIPAIAAMTIFKQKLMPFVILITITVLIINLLEGNFFHNAYKKLIAIALLPIASLNMTHSWHHYLSRIHAQVEWKLRISYSTLHDAFFAPAGSIPHTIIMNYCHALVPVSFFLSVILLINIITSYLKKQKSVFYVVHTILFFGLLLYLFGLLLMYLFSFTTFEGIEHASMDRYLHIYYLGWGLVALHFLFDALRDFQKKGGDIFAYFSIAAIIAGFSGLLTVHFMHQRNYYHQLYSVWNLRQSTIKIANAVNARTNPRAKILTIWQDARGFE